MEFDSLPGSDARLGVHVESGSPRRVFVGRRWHVAAFRRQLLGHGADVIRLKAAAAADVAYPELVRVTRVLVRVPASVQTRLQRYVKHDTNKAIVDSRLRPRCALSSPPSRCPI